MGYSATISQRSMETLIDLLEIKLSSFEVWDRDDQRERLHLEQVRKELLALSKGEMLPEAEDKPRRRRGRPRASEMAATH